MSLPHPFSEIDRPNLRWLVISGVLVLVIAGLVISLFAVSKANNSQSAANTANRAAAQASAAAKAAQEFAQADCGTWHDLAVIPPSPAATESGLKLWAGFIDSYVNKGCVAIAGALPAPDPRLLPYLKTH